jgi:adenylate kinase
LKNIILIAPPGAGKGTQAKMLCEEFNMIHISVGDLLRSEIERKSDLSEKLKQVMKTGDLVEDEIILNIIEKRLNDSDLKNGFILDGFPRNIKQAISLDKITNKIDIVIYLDVAKEELEQRILGRLICTICGNVYNENIESLKPKNANICDKCNSKLEKRLDDTKEVFEKRYDTYIKETHPVLEFYKEKGILYNINSLDKDEIFNNIVNVLRGNV